MNRESKRIMKRQQAVAERERVRGASITGRRGGDDGGDKPEGRLRRWLRFLREVRIELRKVSWPNRREVATYTLVVVVMVTVLAAAVFAFDLTFANTVLEMFQ